MNQVVRLFPNRTLDDAMVGFMLDRLDELRERSGICPRSEAELARVLHDDGFGAWALKLFFEYLDRARALMAVGQIKLDIANLAGSGAPFRLTGERSDACQIDAGDVVPGSAPR